VTGRAEFHAESRLGPVAWMAAIALALCVVGLTHGTEYLGAAAEESAESNVQIGAEEKFQRDVGSATLARKAGFVGLAAIAACCWWSAPRGVRFTWGPAAWCAAAALGWAACSYAWSVNPAETARELIRLYVYAGVAAALAVRFDARQVAFILAFSLAASITVAVAAAAATGNFRPWQPDFRLSGTLHSNVLGQQALLLGIAAAAFTSDRRVGRLAWIVLGAAMAVLLLTKSRTAAVSFLAGLGALRLVTANAKTLLYLGCTGVAVAGAMLMAAALAGAQLERAAFEAMTLGRGEDVTSLTGRLPLWKTIWNDVRERKYQGLGYGAYWLPGKTEDIGDEVQWYPRHAHSAYLELIVNVGLVGLLLVGSTVAFGMQRAALLSAETGFPEYRMYFAFLAAGLVNGLAEAAFVLPRDIGLFMGATICALVFDHSRAAALAPTRWRLDRAYVGAPPPYGIGALD
jgi:exopolysaccharide production protein ExoQ